MNPEPLDLDVDYYVENERWVFTAHYLRKRGYCCENDCRHCPYGFKRSEELGGTGVSPDPERRDAGPT